MKVADPGKLLLLLVAMIGGLVLAIVGALTHDAGVLASGVGLAGTSLGYVTGNGRLAARGAAPQPMLGSRSPSRAQLDALDAAGAADYYTTDDDGSGS